MRVQPATPGNRGFKHKMSNLVLTFASGDYDRVKALHDGRVTVEGCQLAPVVMKTEHIFPRSLQRQEFDITELSASSYLMQTARGDSEFIAIPVFLSRAFRHRCIYVRSDRAIRTPKDLEGKSLGVPEYQTTVSLWLRGIIQDEFGVDLSRIRYRTGGVNEPGRRERLPLQVPDTMTIQPIGDDQTLSGMLASGELDAIIAPNPPKCFVDGHADVARMFPDYVRSEQAYFEATGFFPIMHMVAIRKVVAERHPWLARNLFTALSASKRLAFESLREMARRPANQIVLPWLLAELERTEALMGQNFWPYGLAGNRAELETMCRYSHEQYLAPRRLRVEELFAPDTLELTES